MLTGQSAAGLTCVERSGTAGDAAATRAGVGRSVGVTDVAVTGSTLVYRGRTTGQAWTIAQHVIANSGRYGVASVQVGGRRWTHDPDRLPAWGSADPVVADRQVVITLR